MMNILESIGRQYLLSKQVFHRNAYMNSLSTKNYHGNTIVIVKTVGGDEKNLCISLYFQQKEESTW